MIRTSISATFPKMPNMAAVTRVATQQAVASARVQQAYARGIAEPPKAQKVANPTAYMTPRQIGYLFAAIKLPHQRTGAVTDAWRLFVDDGSGMTQVILLNKSPVARYVHGTSTGAHQQEYLRLSGWTPTPDIRQAVFTAVVAELRRVFTPRLRDALRVGGRRVR